MGKPIPFEWNRLSRIEEQEIIQPALDLVIQRVPNGISHAYLPKALEGIELSTSSTLSQLLKQFEREGAACTLVAIYGAR